MDSVVKTSKRNKRREEDREEQKDALECGQSSYQSREQKAWPLYCPSDESLSSSVAKKQQFDDTSSGYYPSGSSCSYYRQSNCSSPLSSFGGSDLYDELELIKPAQYSQAAGLSATQERVHESSIVSKMELQQRLGRGSPLLTTSTDSMAHILTFLEPADCLRILTMPLCKQWRESYTAHQDLWKVLCLLEPFKAKVGDGNDDSSSDDSDSFCSLDEPEVSEIFGKHRLMYTSFVRCMRYLTRLKEDTRNGKAPSSIDYGNSGFPHFGVSKGLKKFLARKQGVLKGSVLAANVDVSSASIGVSAEGFSTDGARKRRAFQTGPPVKKPKFGKSMITSRLLGPSSEGAPSHLNLPKSCGIYSVVNWMVAYPDVEGIQIICVEALPCLLEDEAQRMTAQRVGLLEVVLQAMLRFSNSLKLHTAAFHTMVLLARPLGGREGMLFDNSMAESSSTLSVMTSSSPPATSCAGAASLDRQGGPRLNGMNGIAIMMESMRRFESEEKLQAMACWAMVNLALVPAQKTMLVSLNGLQATINAMKRHPHSFDVQFRALFALINLVVPCKSLKPLHPMVNRVQGRTEKDVLNDHLSEIIALVITAMTNFWSSETILNRACLVLHNLSQSEDNLAYILWTPYCYQMLEWCITNYATDEVLRRSATSTLQRLQVLLSANESLRTRFAESIHREIRSCTLEMLPPSRAKQPHKID